MSQSTELTTSLGRTWRIKTILFAIALLVLGAWGAYDALYVYPKRGRIHCEFMLERYLAYVEPQRLGEVREVMMPGDASVSDPLGTLQTLSDSDARSALQEARFQWLRSLSRIRNLGAISRENRQKLAGRAPGSVLPASATMFPDPTAELNRLRQLNATRNPPAALNAYDIPLQYLFMIGGFAGFVALVVFYLRVRSKRFRYDPASKRLVLPGGRTLSPEDIAVVDKRKWDKFLVFLTLKDGSPEIKLDLYRYHPLEDWILEMEKLGPAYEPVVEEGESVLCVNVLDGQPVRLILDADTRLPAPDESGRESIYPVVKTAAGEWFVVGIPQRARLRESGLDRAELKVDPETFAVRVAEHDPDNIPERDLRPRDAQDEEPAPEGA